ncbi:MAG: hypothetical protein O3B43_05135 [Chloroflexi bacterium]|nr:hypothetical protein [Chloroflexota bacterium]
MQTKDLSPYIRRLMFVLIIAVATVFAISELGVLLQGGSVARAPQTIELVIPEGAASQVEAGEEPLGIPDEMVFVLGDILLVRNLDVVAHSLGPLFIPPESSASMPLDQADNFAMTCSFTPSKYLGLDVREPTTLGTRVLALGFSVPPTVAIFYIYSLLAFPIRQSPENSLPPLSQTPSKE